MRRRLRGVQRRPPHVPGVPPPSVASTWPPRAAPPSLLEGRPKLPPLVPEHRRAWRSHRRARFTPRRKETRNEWTGRNGGQRLKKSERESGVTWDPRVRYFVGIGRLVLSSTQKKLKKVELTSIVSLGVWCALLNLTRVCIVKP